MTPRRFGLMAWGLAGTLGAVTAAAGAGYRINTTPSVPVGVWRIGPVGDLTRGAVVVICPPDSGTFRLARSRGYLPHGRCPGSYQPLFKPVAALPGDSVTVTAAGLAINGAPIADSRALSRDGAGRAMPAVAAGRYPVAPARCGWCRPAILQASTVATSGRCPRHGFRGSRAPCGCGEVP